MQALCKALSELPNTGFPNMLLELLVVSKVSPLDRGIPGGQWPHLSQVLYPQGPEQCLA